MPGSRYDASTRAKAIRLVREHVGDYPTEWAAMKAVSGRLGMSTETLRKWIRQAENDEGVAAGVSSSESAEIRELRPCPSRANHHPRVRRQRLRHLLSENSTPQASRVGYRRLGTDMSNGQ